MSKRGVMHWITPTPVEGKVQTLCGRLLNRRGFTIAKSLEEVNCGRCHAILKLAIEHALKVGCVQPKDVLPAKMVHRLKRTYAPKKRNVTTFVRDMAADPAKGHQE
jgi:hypothetical protein